MNLTIFFVGLLIAMVVALLVSMIYDYSVVVLLIAFVVIGGGFTWWAIADAQLEKKTEKESETYVSTVKRVNYSDAVYIMAEDGTVFKERKSDFPIVSVGDTIVYLKHPEKDFLKVLELRLCDKQEVVVTQEKDAGAVPIPMPIPVPLYR